MSKWAKGRMNTGLIFRPKAGGVCGGGVLSCMHVFELMGGYWSFIFVGFFFAFHCTVHLVA